MNQVYVSCARNAELTIGDFLQKTCPKKQKKWKKWEKMCKELDLDSVEDVLEISSESFESTQFPPYLKDQFRKLRGRFDKCKRAQCFVVKHVNACFIMWIEEDVHL